MMSGRGGRKRRAAEGPTSGRDGAAKEEKPGELIPGLLLFPVRTAPVPVQRAGALSAAKTGVHQSRYFPSFPRTTWKNRSRSLVVTGPIEPEPTGR